MECTNPPERSPVVSLCDVRRARQHAQTAERAANLTGSFPDLAAIALEPSYAVRRRKLADAMRQVSGSEPDAPVLDHQMILLGLAAGHGCAGHGSDDGSADNGEPWPLGSGFADPAVIVGLVLHHVEHGAKRGMAIPKSLLAALDHHVEAGSAAARLVRDWLNARSVPCGRRRLWVREGGKP
ncbi:hypothetical protein GCM10007908_24370 [Rhizobium albus]|nr:hypothetical protein GCM10007908_24370 [Rhizobium albus]